MFPSVSRFTRVCAYDRPGTRLEGPDVSTPVEQPHSAYQAADDLHRLLMAAGEQGPYVLVPHSYGGLVATLFARSWPQEVDGLVMVDAATPLIREVASPAALSKWDTANRRSSPGALEAVELLDAFARIPRAQQKKVNKFVRKFREDPTNPSINYESISTFEDPNLRTVRIDQAYRAIVLKPEQGNVYVLLWVDNHDEAMAWARHKHVSIHPETGALQVLTAGAVDVPAAPAHLVVLALEGPLGYRAVLAHGEP